MKPKKNPFVKSRAIQGKMYVILNRDTFLLDEVGQTIWEIVDGRADFKQIVNHVAEKFNALPEEVEKDIEEYLLDLTKNNLVTV